MDEHRFDALTRLLAAASTRRGALGSLLGVLTGIPPAAAPDEASAQGAGRCLALGWPCFRRRGFPCCGEAICQHGRCRCPKRKRPCRGRCLGKNRCCRNAECRGGQVCRRARCQCRAGQRLCAGRCIPKRACCRDTDCEACQRCQGRECVATCGPDQVCDNETCQCAPGFKECNGGCIPETECCDCDEGAGQRCLANGTCVTSCIFDGNHNPPIYCPLDASCACVRVGQDDWCVQHPNCAGAVGPCDGHDDCQTGAFCTAVNECRLTCPPTGCVN